MFTKNAHVQKTGVIYIRKSPEPPEIQRSVFFSCLWPFWAPGGAWIHSYRIFHADTHLQTPISWFRTPIPSNFMKIQKIRNVVANIFRILFEKMPLTKILRPNLWAKNDPMVILSLSTFRGKVRFDCIFSIEISLFHGKPLFHFEPSGIYFERFLFPS